MVYKGKLESGELEIAEPDKCIGYERYKIGEVDETELMRELEFTIKEN